VIEAKAGDRYLLCSDGLSSVVSEETLYRILATVKEPDDAVLQLIELAIKGGGPDNITCIVADVVDDASALRPPSKGSVLAGAASNGDRPMLRTNSPAGRAHALSQTTPQPAIVVDHDDSPRRPPDEPEPDERPRRRWPIVTSILVLLLIVIIGGIYAGWRYTQDQYYVGTDGSNVAVYQGINQSVLGVRLSHVHQRTDIPLSRVPTTDQGQIRATIPATSLAGVESILSNIRSSYEACKTAYAGQAAYNIAQANYKAALRKFDKQYKVSGARPAVNPKTHKIIKTPPSKPKLKPVTIPANCPPPPRAHGNGSGS
jgi:protein phosphatase